LKLECSTGEEKASADVRPKFDGLELCSLVSPCRADREEARRLEPRGKFNEVYLNAPREVCEQRDMRGLYARARAGEIKEFTGISAPHEPPLDPELKLATDKLSVAECVSAILERLNKMTGT
jgi:adenylylsulfate kinase